MLVLANLVLERTAEGPLAPAADIPLLGAPDGYRRFAAVCAAGDVVHYMVRGVDIVDRPTGQWEAGRGTIVEVDGTMVLRRTTVVETSDGTAAALSLFSGKKQVMLAQLAPSSHPLVLQDMQDMLGGSPPGMRAEFAGAAAPTGWLATGAGKVGNRTTHRRLFELVGVTFGAGDGATTFGLPTDVASRANHVACIRF